MRKRVDNAEPNHRTGLLIDAARFFASVWYTKGMIYQALGEQA